MTGKGLQPIVGQRVHNIPSKMSLTLIGNAEFQVSANKVGSRKQRPVWLNSLHISPNRMLPLIFVHWNLRSVT